VSKFVSYNSLYSFSVCKVYLLCHVFQKYHNLSCYNFDVHESILTLFGRNFTEKVSNKMCIIFLPHPTNVSALPGKQVIWKSHIFTYDVCCFTKNTQNTLKCHLVTAEPSFTVKTIDCVHQTGLNRTGA